jgi:DnaD/phage-associated family protein
MADGAYKVRSAGVLGSEAFLEASREELRILVAVMERPWGFSDLDELAEAAGVSRARAASAVALFCETGIFVREGEVSYEFAKRTNDDDEIERTSAEVAKSIRNRGLASLFADLAAMMEKDTLNTDEIKRINSLVEDEGLSEEYILSLAAFIASHGTLATNKLIRRAKSLIKLEIDTPERLEEYIKRQENGNSLEYEFRNTFGKYFGNATKSELDYYRKWTETFAFTPEIILLAQDLNVLAKSSYTYAYMDTLLTRWHKCGCKTPDECKAQAERDRESIREQKRIENSRAMPQKSKQTESAAPKFSDFDAEAALEQALKRSYAQFTDEK